MRTQPSARKKSIYVLRVDVWLKKAGVGAPAKDANRAMFLATAYMPLVESNIFLSMPSPRPKVQSKPKTKAKQLPTRLAELAAQVRSQPPAAALPCNLSDELLELIEIDLDAMLSEAKPKDSDSRPEAQALGLVLHILAGLPGDGKPGILLADLFAAVENYRLEVDRELKNRRARLPYMPATLDNIFVQGTVNLEIGP